MRTKNNIVRYKEEKDACEEGARRVACLRSDRCPLRCKASLGMTRGNKLGSPSSVTSVGIPLHFRLKSVKGGIPNGLASGLANGSMSEAQVTLWESP